MNEHFFILLLSIIIASFSQILLKKSTHKEHKNIIREYLNVYVLSGYGLLLVSTVLTVIALRGMDYKNVPITEALGYVFIMILSAVILKEKITKKKIIGNALILLGIAIYYI